MPITTAMTQTDKKGEQPTRNEKLSGMVREYYEQKKSQDVPIVAKQVPFLRSPLVAVTAITLCVAAWVVPPVIDRATPFASSEEMDRSARLSIYLASLSVREAQARVGRIPMSKSEASVVDSAISYRRLSDSTFELSTVAGERTVAYRSTSDIALFLRRDSVIARKF